MMRFTKAVRFTLIELLIVVSIIALLAAMLLPALSRAKFAAKEVICMNNLSQHGTGLMMYASENSNKYYWRYQGGYYIPRQISRKNNAFFDIHEVIEEYVPPSDVYTCPFAVKNGQPFSMFWPIVGKSSSANGFNFWTYNLWVNYASGGVNHYKTDGTVANWAEVVPRKAGERGKEHLPTMSCQATEQGSTGIFWNQHANAWYGQDPTVQLLRGNTLYQDGAVELNKNGDGYVKVFKDNASGGLRYWRPRD